MITRQSHEPWWLSLNSTFKGCLRSNIMSTNKSLNFKQTCVNCHFFVYTMKSRSTDMNKEYHYKDKVVDVYYRNWIKEKLYNSDQPTVRLEKCDIPRYYDGNSNDYYYYNDNDCHNDNDNDKDKEEIRWVFTGLKCYKTVWPVREFSGGWIPRTPETPSGFLNAVPKYREKAFEEITEVDRSGDGDCFFYGFKQGMDLETAVELEERENQNKKTGRQKIKDGQINAKTNLLKSSEYIRRDDDEEKFYAKAKGRTAERLLDLKGQSLQIFHCLFNKYDKNVKNASVDIHTVLLEAAILKHKKGDNIGKNKRDHLSAKITPIKGELGKAGFDSDRIKLNKNCCELHIDCSYHD